MEVIGSLIGQNVLNFLLLHKSSMANFWSDVFAWQRNNSRPESAGSQLLLSNLLGELLQPLIFELLLHFKALLRSQLSLCVFVHQLLGHL